MWFEVDISEKKTSILVGIAVLVIVVFAGVFFLGGTSKGQVTNLTFSEDIGSSDHSPIEETIEFGKDVMSI
ncbi:hypothetical protein AKJ37_06320 [candidate division MSBL1 archaeon SCGC-AAA259I09]|uniref:Uncharacterized protein n=3 Tax=candidate division MSBL1 TaxID=215777 RepID=A0A133UP59_9EURY|nr:hypothetical protein AKJ37_06320 [candidate division MSBL1 archaeon SCGC-AAA259I09]KXA96996.1 hypothetical protein AKJ39_03845 [candidate division MSBL1 archaeon SCGC-AAA259J03]KXA99522.1 hypothetical protein AKJ40_02965 [candidate division MSBL1 archaeon SCGC-AAA259M10]